jgi:superfamily II DNA helicase RecQ
MLALAQAQPTSPRALERFVPPGIQRRIGGEILGAIQRGKALGPFARVPPLPSRSEESELDEAELELHERLKQWRKVRAQREHLDSSLVLNRRVLLRLAEDRPATRAALEKIDGLLAWQIELFGDELLAVVRAFERDLADGRIEPRRRGRR